MKATLKIELLHTCDVTFDVATASYETLSMALALLATAKINSVQIEGLEYGYNPVMVLQAKIRAELARRGGIVPERQMAEDSGPAVRMAALGGSLCQKGGAA